MPMKRALQVILVISLVGVVFSGTLTWREVFAASEAGCTAVGTTGTILGYPPCVYGLVMYGVVAALAVAGLVSGHRR